MILGPRRIALIAVIAAVALAIIFYPLIVFTPINVDDVRIDFTRIVLDDSSDEQELLLRPTFSITNNSTMTLTTSRIDYELFADGSLVGEKTLSYEDVPPNGRPALFPDTRVPLTDSFPLEYGDDRADLFNRILNQTSAIEWSVRGSATIESGTTLVVKEFESTLQN